MKKAIQAFGIKPFLVLVMVVMMGVNPVRATSFEEGASAFVAQMSDEAVALLSNQTLSVDEQREGFRALLQKHFDVATIGKWVLGRNWRRASDAQRTEYLELFEKLLVRTYVDRFKDYNGETLNVGKAVKVGERDALVQTVLVSPGTQVEPVMVDWRVRARSGDYRVIDVMVAGVSLGQTQRSEFASVIRKEGGKVEALLAQLREE